MNVITPIKRAKPTASKETRSRMGWTGPEITELLELHAAGFSNSEIGATLNRSPQSIYMKMNKIKHPLKNPSKSKAVKARKPHIMKNPTPEILNKSITDFIRGTADTHPPWTANPTQRSWTNAFKQPSASSSVLQVNDADVIPLGVSAKELQAEMQLGEQYMSTLPSPSNSDNAYTISIPKPVVAALLLAAVAAAGVAVGTLI